MIDLARERFTKNLWTDRVSSGKPRLVTVRDEGAGMDSEVLERVADPFFTTKAPGKGMGLGLSVTYGVVQDHHGQISCENRPEGGAVFILRFPLAKQAAPKMAEAAQA